MQATDLDPKTLALLAVCGIAGLGLFVLWIITLVKEFKAGDTLWGVLTIFFSGICGPIWSFMNGHKGLGAWWIILIVVYLISYVMAVLPLIMEGVQAAPAAG